ncbi:MAG: sterol desaturase family protein [Saprospirales bacterium]|nr:MAG: sterol desaturase family protein [Saprospirales bacterium]
MEFLIEYFSDIPASHRTVILLGGLTIFLLLENAAPLFRLKYHKWKHLGINMFFTLTTIVVNFAMAFLLFMASDWAVTNEFGVLFWLPISGLWMALVGVMLMDFISAWLAHYLQHKSKFLWLLHLVHHSDQQVDVTTANRHHPFESVFRFSFTLLAVIIVGAPLWMVLLYQSLSVILSQFNHSNIKMPDWLDNMLVWVICTPNMHRVHHHYRQPYTDKNFGNIFSLWDRIFGTYVKVDNKKLVYGLDTYMAKEEADDIRTLMKLPLLGYRPPVVYEEEEEL